MFPGSGSNAPNEYLPDRPIGYGAFGVVWSVTDPRDGKRVALKKLPNVFQSLVSSKRVFRELKMMRFFKHENVLSCLDILQVHINLNMLYVPSSIQIGKYSQTNIFFPEFEFVSRILMDFF